MTGSDLSFAGFDLFMELIWGWILFPASCRYWAVRLIFLISRFPLPIFRSPFDSVLLILYSFVWRRRRLRSWVRRTIYLGSWRDEWFLFRNRRVRWRWINLLAVWCSWLFLGLFFGGWCPVCLGFIFLLGRKCLRSLPS